jgi:hypothetical protein
MIRTFTKINYTIFYRRQFITSYWRVEMFGLPRGHCKFRAEITMNPKGRYKVVKKSEVFILVADGEDTIALCYSIIKRVFKIERIRKGQRFDVRCWAVER